MNVLEKKNKSIMKTYMIYFIVVVLFILVRILVSENILVISNDYLINSIGLNSIVQVGILFLVPMTLYCILLKVSPKSVFKTCNVNKPNYKILLWAVVFGLLAFIFNIIISSVGMGIISFFGYHQHTVSTNQVYEMKHFIADIFLTALLPALFEEFTHRGILLQGTKHAGFKQAIYISAICFGLAHLNIEQLFYAIALGVFLGTIVVATKSIWPAVVIHFINNFISVYLTGASAFGWWGGNYGEAISSFQQNVGMVAFIAIIMVTFIVVLTLMCWIVYRMYRVSMVLSVEKALTKTHEEKIKIVGKNNDYNKNSEVKNIVETSTNLNFDYDSMKDLMEFVLPKEKNPYKKTFKDNIFLIVTIVLGIIVNIFTFIWGII